jgi:superfamily II DNA/RNA helicase
VRVVGDHEADRMLDMGFIPILNLSVPNPPRNAPDHAVFSNDAADCEIRKHSSSNNPKRIEVSRAASTNENITHPKCP